MLVSQILNILSILAIAGRVGADLSPSMGDGDGGTVSSGNDGPSANSDTTKGNNTFDGANHDAKSSDRDEGGSNSGGGDDSNSGASSGNIESGGDVTSGHQSGTGAVSGEPVAADGKGESSAASEFSGFVDDGGAYSGGRGFSTVYITTTEQPTATITEHETVTQTETVSSTSSAAVPSGTVYDQVPLLKPDWDPATAVTLKDIQDLGTDARVVWYPQNAAFLDIFGLTMQDILPGGGCAALIYYANMKKRFKNGQKSDWDQTKSDDSVWWATYPTGAASVCADDVFELTVPPPEKLPDRALEVHTFQFWDTDEEASFIVVLGNLERPVDATPGQAMSWALGADPYGSKFTARYDAEYVKVFSYDLVPNGKKYEKFGTEIEKYWRNGQKFFDPYRVWYTAVDTFAHKLNDLWEGNVRWTPTEE